MTALRELESQVGLTARFPGRSAGEVFDLVADVERFPSLMSVVDSTVVEGVDGARRRTAWAILLRGSLLRWREEAVLDPVARTIRFEQLDGDLELFAGEWTIGTSDSGAVVRMEMRFKIGIPLMAAMLQPVACEAIRESLSEMMLALGGAVVDVEGAGATAPLASSDRDRRA